MAEKIKNLETGKLVTVGGKRYNELINDGYVHYNGELFKPSHKQLKAIKEEERLELERIEREQRMYKQEYEEENEQNEKEYEEEYEEENEEKYEEEKEYNEKFYPTYVERKHNYQEYTETIPFVRCFECGKPIGTLHQTYERLKLEGYPPEEIYKKLNITRYCCMKNLEYPQQIPTMNEQLTSVQHVPSTKVVKCKPNNVNISDNPYLSNKQNVIVSDTNMRVYGTENESPKTTIVNYTTLPKRSLGKYQVSYLGK